MASQYKLEMCALIFNVLCQPSAHKYCIIYILQIPINLNFLIAMLIVYAINYVRPFIHQPLPIGRTLGAA